VEINRRAGVAARGTARAALEAINRVAGRNILLNRKERREKMKKEVGVAGVETVRAVVRMSKVHHWRWEARTCISKRELDQYGSALLRRPPSAATTAR
jgi:hypothetical protein